jgi:hypothetical protein
MALELPRWIHLMVGGMGSVRAPVQCRFEIRSNSHPGENRYYASAPVPTDVHLDLLEEQERLFS